MSMKDGMKRRMERMEDMMPAPQSGREAEEERERRERMIAYIDELIRRRQQKIKDRGEG